MAPIRSPVAGTYVGPSTFLWKKYFLTQWADEAHTFAFRSTNCVSKMLKFEVHRPSNFRVTAPTKKKLRSQHFFGDLEGPSTFTQNGRFLRKIAVTRKIKKNLIFCKKKVNPLSCPENVLFLCFCHPSTIRGRKIDFYDFFAYVGPSTSKVPALLRSQHT